MAPKPCLRDTGGTFLPFKHFSFVHYRLLRCERIFYLFFIFIFFSRGDYIPHTHMLAQSYCRAIRRRAYFILGRAGVNVKIWVWRLKRTDAQARYIAVALVVAAAAVKIVVNNIAGGVNQPHRVVRSLFFLTRLLYYRHVQTWKHLGGLP